MARLGLRPREDGGVATDDVVAWPLSHVAQGKLVFLVVGVVVGIGVVVVVVVADGQEYVQVGSIARTVGINAQDGRRWLAG